jgi:hypothetical protein
MPFTSIGLPFLSELARIFYAAPCGKWKLGTLVEATR